MDELTMRSTKVSNQEEPKSATETIRSGIEVTLYLPEKTLAKLEGAIRRDRDLMSTTQAVYHFAEAGMKLAELNPGAPLSSLSALAGRLPWTGAIDLRDRKGCSEKTLDYYIKPWHVFGRSRDGKTVDVADIDQDVFTGVLPDVAEKLIQERQRHADAIFDIVNAGCDDGGYEEEHGIIRKVMEYLTERATSGEESMARMIHASSPGGFKGVLFLEDDRDAVKFFEEASGSEDVSVDFEIAVSRLLCPAIEEVFTRNERVSACNWIHAMSPRVVLAWAAVTDRDIREKMSDTSWSMYSGGWGAPLALTPTT